LRSSSFARATLEHGEYSVIREPQFNQVSKFVEAKLADPVAECDCREHAFSDICYSIEHAANHVPERGVNSATRFHWKLDKERAISPHMRQERKY
jgi:hypothetical protein